jgi:hypothetical protein
MRRVMRRLRRVKRRRRNKEVFESYPIRPVCAITSIRWQIGSITAHKLYHAALTIPHTLCVSRLIVSYWTLVADNYAPMVSHILMDALLNPEYLHLPRMALYGTKTDDRLPAARHMRLFGDLLSGGVTSPKQVCSIFRLL